MGPMEQIFAYLKAKNDASRAQHPGLTEYVHNSRVGPLVGMGRPAPDPRGDGPIHLDSQVADADTPRFLEFGDHRVKLVGEKPRVNMYYRDPQQAGPEPPASAGGRVLENDGSAERASWSGPMGQSPETRASIFSQLLAGREQKRKQQR